MLSIADLLFFSPYKIPDAAGRPHPIQQRVDILAISYATTQWHNDPLPPFADRPPLFQIPPELPTGVLSPDELRIAALHLKKNKTPGMDEISS